MNILQTIADDRENNDRDRHEADDRWMRERAGVDPEERRRRWRQWLCKHLAESLQLSGDQAARDRLVGQLAAEVQAFIRQLFGRGWMLDGDALSREVRAIVKPIAEAQRAGKVDDLFAYFRSSVRRYAGAHAEDLQALARRSGADNATQTVGAILAGLRGAINPRGPSLTEVLVTDAPAVRPARGRPRKSEVGDETLPLL